MYRHAILTNSTTHISAAEKAYTLVQNSIDAEGWLQSTVDPMLFNVPSEAGAYSPEGQSFVLLLEAARDAWLASTGGTLSSALALEPSSA